MHLAELNEGTKERNDETGINRDGSCASDNAGKNNLSRVIRVRRHKCRNVRTYVGGIDNGTHQAQTKTERNKRAENKADEEEKERGTEIERNWERYHPSSQPLHE